MSIRIILADDHRMFREALRIPLEYEPDLQIVGEAGCGAELLALLEVTAPDILILDIGLPDMNGVEVARIVAEKHPGIRIIALTGYTDAIFLDEMIKAGARGFVVKSAGSEELIFAIRAASAGKIFLSPEMTPGMVRHVPPRDPGAAPPLSVLGKREREVLRLLAEGLSSPEIARTLGISPATADVHRRNIKQKLRLGSIAEMTRYAIREGLISVK